MPLDPVPDLGEIRFLKHRDAGSIVNALLVFIRRNARELIVGVLALVGPLYLGISLLSTVFFGRVFGTDPAVLAENPFALFGGTYFGLLGLSLMAAIVGQAAVGGYVRLYRLGEAGAITVGRLWEEARDLLVPLLAANAAVYGVFLLTALVNIIPCLGQIAWLAIVIWAIPYVTVMLASRVVETDSVAEAWARARVLVKGEWGLAFGTLLLVGVLVVVAFIALAIPQQAVLWAFGVGFGEMGPTWLMAVVQTPIAVVSSVLYALPFAAAFFVHGRLVEDLEGTHLVDDLDALADRSTAARWADGPASSAALDAPPATDLPSTPPDDSSGDDAPSGFRGGGFGSSGGA